MIEQGDVMTLNNTSWFDGSGNTVEFSEILKYITSKKDTHEIHVGSDSQPYHSYVIFAITVCLYLPGRGATYYVSRKKSKSKAYKNLGVRLQYESELAIYVANHIRESLALDDITIQADISPNPIFYDARKPEGIVLDLRNNLVDLLEIIGLLASDTPILI